MGRRQEENVGDKSSLRTQWLRTEGIQGDGYRLAGLNSERKGIMQKKKPIHDRHKSADP